jgi:hypothetical protein
MARTRQVKNAKETKTTEKVNEPKTQDQIIEHLVAKIKQNLTVEDSKYVQVNENFKKVGPGLSLSGLLRLYKQEDKANFVLIPEFKVAGTTAVVEKLLSTLGSSLQQQKDKSGVIDVNNYESFAVVRDVAQDGALASLLISSDKISEIAKFVKTNKTKPKDERDTPKKKKAQRRKSPTGVKLEKSPRISVSPLENLTLESLVDLLKRLAEKQEGLDVSTTTFERTDAGLTVVGAKLFKIKAGSRSKRTLVDTGVLRGLGSESAEALEAFLKQVGQTDAEVKTCIEKFKAARAEPNVAEPKAKPKKAAKKEQAKDKAKEAKKEVKDEGKHEVKDEGKHEAKDKAKDKAKEQVKPKKDKSAPAKKASKSATPAKSAPKAAAKTTIETTKAKTRDVKPRTSKN